MFKKVFAAVAVAALVGCTSETSDPPTEPGGPAVNVTVQEGKVSTREHSNCSWWVGRTGTICYACADGWTGCDPRSVERMTE